MYQSLLRTLLLTLILALPLIGGAIYLAATHSDIAQAWQRDEQPAGAPIAQGSSSGLSPEHLAEIRRAAGEADSQVGFLTTGTGELATNADQLKTKTGEITSATGELVDGSQQLTDGLVQLQAGTTQLGDGATKVADGVSQAVEQVQGLALLQPQILQAIDDMDKKLAEHNNPEAADARKQLAGFRSEVSKFAISGEKVDQLAELRSGSRELADQLNKPGSPYHDGIFQATDGSKRLTSGLRELDAGAGAAVQGLNDFAEGTKRVDVMAQQSKGKTNAIQRTLPANVAAVDNGAHNTQPTSVKSLPPMYGFAIAALVSVAGVAFAWAGRHGWKNIFGAVVLLTATGGVLFGLFAADISFGDFIAGLSVIALACLVFVVGACAVIALFGKRLGRVMLVVGGLVQLGVVGWVWKTTAAAETALWVQAVSGLMPLHYPTSALVAIGNDGSNVLLSVSMLVLMGLGIFGGGVVLRRAEVNA